MCANSAYTHMHKPHTHICMYTHTHYEHTHTHTHTHIHSLSVRVCLSLSFPCTPSTLHSLIHTSDLFSTISHRDTVPQIHRCMSSSFRPKPPTSSLKLRKGMCTRMCGCVVLSLGVQWHTPWGLDGWGLQVSLQLLQPSLGGGIVLQTVVEGCILQLLRQALSEGFPSSGTRQDQEQDCH